MQSNISLYYTVVTVLSQCYLFYTSATYLQNNSDAAIELCILEFNPIILNINNNTKDWWWFQQFAGVSFCQLTKGVSIWVNCSVCCLLSSFPGVSWLRQEHGSQLTNQQSLKLRGRSLCRTKILPVTHVLVNPFMVLMVLLDFSTLRPLTE